MNVGELKKFLNNYSDDLPVTTNRRSLSEISDEVDVVVQATCLMAHDNRVSERDQLVIVTNIGKCIF